MDTKEEYVLMMPVVQQEETGETMFFPSSAMSGAIEQVPVTYEALAGLAKQFTGFEMDTIELHVKALAKTGGITQLIVGLEGEAGVKLTLKKKKEE